MSGEYDLVVIGGGPAGERGAAQAAYFGKRVAIVEREPEPGGAAVHTGTLPSKTLRETALFLSGYRQRQLDGVLVDLDPELTVTRLLERKAIALKADYAEAYNNRGVALRDLRRLEESLASYDRAMALLDGVDAPDSPAMARDMAALRVLSASGARPRAYTQRLTSVAVLQTYGDRTVLSVRDLRAAYDLVDTSGRVVEHRAARPEASWQVELVRLGGDWRVADVVPA